MDEGSKEFLGARYHEALANARQVGGDHYKGQKYEHWDVVADHGLDYFQGQITRYVMRWKRKAGIVDLKKALHTLEKYIEIEEAKIACPITEATMPEADNWYLNKAGETGSDYYDRITARSRNGWWSRLISACFTPE